MKTRLLFVFEFPPGSDAMARSLLEEMRRLRPDLEVVPVAGMSRQYEPGGLRLERALNLAWVYAQVAWRLLLTRPDAVLVRSTPPGVQLWTMAWARGRDVPVIAWLMDNHPEIEARLLERSGWRRSARVLRDIDARVLPHFAQVVVLDPAMAEVVRSRAPDVEIVVHPTWSGPAAALPTPVSYQPGADAGSLHLAYSGNLGVAHDLSGLRALLETLRACRTVRLWIVGASEDGAARMRRVGEELGVTVTVHPRVPFAELRELYERWRIDLGIVLLAEESAGLLSPSKFSGYINFGVPLLYLGPAGTNAAEICQRFGGGFHLPSAAGQPAIAALADRLVDPAQVAGAAAGAATAARHFGALDAATLAACMVRRIPGPGCGAVAPLEVKQEAAR